MWRFPARLLFRLMLRLPALTLILSVLVCYAPGFDSDERQLDLRLSTESLERLKAGQAGVRDPLQTWGRMLRGDLGYSESFARPVSELLAERAPVTLQAAGTGLLLGWTLADLPWLCAALSGFRFLETTCKVLAGILICVPAALLAFFSVLSNLPAAFAIAAIIFARVYPYLDRIFAQTRELPHMLSARGLGISHRRLFLRHILPVAGPQIVTVLAGSVIISLGAAVPVEVICDSPGLGQLAWRATLGRDLPVLLSVTLVMSTIAIAASSWSDTQARVNGVQVS